MLRMFVFAAACTIGLGAAAQAQNADPAGSKLVARNEVPVNGRMAMHVHSYALKELETVVTDRDVVQPMFLRLILIAKQEATAISCEGFEKDDKRMLPAMWRTLQPVIQGAEPGVPNARLNTALRAYNIMMGGELAIFAQDPDGYCDYGKKVVDEIGMSEDEKSLLVITQAP